MPAGWKRAAVAWALSAVAAGATAGGCSSDPAVAVDDADAAAPAPEQATTDATAAGVLDRATTLAAAFPELASRFAPNADGFVSGRDGVTSPGWRSAWTDRSEQVGARLPSDASGPFEAGVGVSELYRVRLGIDGASPAPLLLDRGRAAYVDVLPSTDLVWVAEPDRVEWSYVLRDERAPTELHVDVDLPPNLQGVRVDPRGAIELLDELERPVLRIPRPFAVDAEGVRRDVGMEWDGRGLALRVNTEGLAFPVLVDPAVETLVWSLRFDQPASADGSGFAWDSSRQRLLFFATSLGKLWEWDGGVWTLRSSAGPTGLGTPELAYDSVRNVTVLVGDNGTAMEVWEWDGAAFVKKCTTAPCSTTVPPRRTFFGLTYDPIRAKTFMFWGSGASALNDTWSWNGSAWSLLAGTGAPSARYDCGFTWDANGSRTLAFGGGLGAGGYTRETYAFNGSVWSLISNTGPVGRRGGRIAYESQRLRTLLFGGFDGSGYTTDAWELNGSTWSSVVGGPSGRLWPSMGYDPTRGAATIRGGTGSGSDEFWEFNGTSWSAVEKLPSPRSRPGVGFDSARGRTVIFSGFGLQSSDTWEWTGLVWQKVCQGACAASVPGPRGNAGSTYSTSQGLTLVVNGSGSVQYTDIWGWNGTSWTQLCTSPPCSSTRPGLRDSTAMAFDTTRSRAVLFGGRSTAFGETNDTWEWTGSAWLQLCTTAPCSNTVPIARDSAAMAYDANLQRTVMFGGREVGGSIRSDTWQWSGTAWTQFSPATIPPPRFGASMYYDSLRKKTVLYGGVTTGGAHLTDAWQWNGSNWSSIPSTPAVTLSHGAAVYDSTQSRGVLFGGLESGDPYGGPGATSGATWQSYTHGGACTTSLTCQTGYCVDGVCCDTLSCGICQRCDGATPGTCSAVTSADDPDSCSSTTMTCDAQGACKKKQGQACAAAGDCASGYCADGVCCNAGCTGGCDACSTAAGAAINGTCALRGAGSAGVNPSCSGYLCQGTGGDCPTSCSADAQCGASYYCDRDNTCQPRRTTGAACNTAAGPTGDCEVAGCRECTSGNCVDFVCCGSACNTACQTCAGATPGTCSSVTNADDADTCTGTSTCSAAGSCKKKLGQSCTLATDCASGFCADGVCCNAGCTGGCDVCKASLGASADGQCSLLSAGVAGTGCGNYSCSGATGACPSSCSSDSACVASAYCRTSDGTCQADQANGGACSTGAQCTSTFCVDGFCCNTACGGACQACSAGKTGGANGVCSNVTTGTDPDAECTQDAASTCQRDGTCAAGACRLYASGTTCGTASCTAGVASTSTCDGTGTCSAAQTSCGAYACTAGACATTCSADPQCASGYYCAPGGSCAAKKTGGATCTAGNECATGFCVDGVCCDTGCNQPCQACSAAKKGSGSSGSCGAIKVDTDPDAECATTGGTCGQTGNCNGSGACKVAASGTVCGTTSCAAGIQTGQQCDGTGTCANGSQAACSAGYACLDATVCASSCTSDSQCAGGYWCRTGDGTCQPRQGVGAACTGSNQCSLGNCVDGFCCDGTCAGKCQACSAAKKGQGANGTCGSIKVGSDPDAECAATSATGCDTTGSCDGNGACQLWAAGTSCGTTTCTLASPVDTQAGSSCDGFGTCQTSSQTSCGLYHCSGSACATTCIANSGCQAAAYCDTVAHTCVADKANGAACGADAECANGFCVDGVCCGQACTGTCQACSAALKGAGVDGVCEAIVKGSDPQAECADQGSTSCGTNGSCNGFGACDLYAAGVACGTTTCTPDAVTGGTQTGSSCNGSGTCVQASSSTCAPYVCQGGACGGACVSQADCIASYWCDTASGTCKPDQANSAPCGAAGECTSGNCVDGVCCDGVCAGSCQACVASKTGAVDGQCRSISGGTDPDDECADLGSASCGTNGLCSGSGSCSLYAVGVACGSTTCTAGQQAGSACNGQGQCVTGQQSSCGLYVCQGASCGSTCAIDDECVTSAFCNATTGACTSDGGLGSTCDRDAQCQSGHCTDGVCCDQACQGACQACSAAKKQVGGDGNCGPVASGADPDNDCAATAPATCGTDGACDGSGACRKHQPGTSCGSTTCGGATSSQLSGEQCDGFGACKTAQVTACDPYVCTNASSCPTSCVSNANCVPGWYCASDGTCKTQGANGATCTGADGCRTGFCVEGVCCDSACTGECQSCSAAHNTSGQDGVCSNAKTGDDPHNDCDATPVTACGQDGTCDGNGRCHLYSSGTACGATSCNGDTQTGYACDGTGTCNANSAVPCELYACTGGACRPSCVADGDCSGTAYCDLATSTCVARSPSGTACDSPRTCTSGFCADGVCCDSACSGQCQACDLPTALGTCSPVIGAPHGARTACAAAPGTSPDQKCQARSCDGTVDVNTCVGFVGSDTPCRDQACDPATGTQTFSAACDGKGACGLGDGSTTIKRCAPFVCGADVCLDVCNSDQDCAPGNRCETTSGQCVSSTTCDGDHTLTAADGTQTDCSPFQCDASGTCIDRCSITAECITGYVCNGDHVCVRPAGAAPEADSGCGCRAAGTPLPRGLPLAALALIILGAGPARRRVRAQASRHAGRR